MTLSETLLIAIPTYNERENIGSLLPALLTLNPTAHIVVIDDNSPDGTGDLVARLSAADSRIRLIRRDRKRGIGMAYRSGFAYALEHAYRLVLTMDADFSHAPEQLDRLLGAIASADVVVGSRYIPGGRIENWPLFRRALSQGGNVLARGLVGASVRDWTSGFRCYRREVLESLRLDGISSEGYSFLIEILFDCERHRWRITEVPITFVDRRFGHTKISQVEAYKSVATLLRIAWRKITS